MDSIALARPKLTWMASFILLFAAAQLVAFNLQAETTTHNDHQQQLIALYDELLDNPTDIERTLAYAELAVKMGDYEAAIPPLERLLLTNPNATKISFELGVLYYLLGAYDVSRDYFADVKKQAETQEELAQMADAYLKRM